MALVQLKTNVVMLNSLVKHKNTKSFCILFKLIEINIFILPFMRLKLVFNCNETDIMWQAYEKACIASARYFVRVIVL